MPSRGATGLERLRAGGFRLTRQRAAVLAVIEGSEGHLGVREVLRAVRRNGRRIGLTTV
ncbi:MAG: transcriptional repressor, partial [Candidatus Methylomirabilales bacterium]